MPHGYREGRITPGLAGFVLVVAMTAGCGRLPVQPFGPASSAEAPTPETKAISAPPDATPEGPVELEILPSLPVTGEPLVESPGIPSAAPLLDPVSALVSGPPPAEPSSAPTASPIPQPAPEPVNISIGIAQAGRAW